MNPTPAPYRPPVLTPGMARLCDTLSSRAALAETENPLSFHYFDPVGAARRPAARLTLEAGGFHWRLEFYSLDFLLSNQAFAGVDLGRLPKTLIRAALLTLLHPFLDRLENALKIELNPYDEPGRAPDAQGWLEPTLCFTLNFTEDSARARYWRVPLGLRVASEKGAVWLCARVLDAFPRPWKNPERAAWPLAVTLEAGSMWVPMDLLQNLSVADILIPPVYPAKDGHLRLILPGGSGFSLDVSDARAVVTDFSHDVYDKEMNVNPSDLPDGKPALASMQVQIHFELERKLLPLAEIEALAPGRVFPLGTDPMSPVTVTLNGQALAAGRLVDLGGALGVQIVRLIKAPETS